jgi:isoleucyl-tRNA synthetase
MDRLRDVASVGLSLRREHQLRVRLPLAALTVAGRDGHRLAPFVDLLRDEVNVKEVVLSDDLEAFGTFLLKPVGAVVGPKLGGDTQKVMKAAREGEWTANDDGTVTVAGHVLGEGEFELALKPVEGTAAAALRANDAVVLLDVEITADLAAEGLARDLVRLVQQARREADLAVTDRIALTLALPAGLAIELEPWLDFVAGEVLATSTEVVEPGAALPGSTGEGTLDGQPVAFSLTVA